MGKIKKIKLGFNPNSSSIGTELVLFFASSTVLATLFNAIAVYILRRKKVDALSSKK